MRLPAICHFLFAGMDAYLSKPIRTTELFTTIERFLGASTEPSESNALQTQDELAPLI